MHDDLIPDDWLVTGLTEEASARKLRIRCLVEALEVIVEKDGPEVAASWARRAVSPLLDYSTLLRLRRFTRPVVPSGHEKQSKRLAILGGPTTTQLRELIEVFLDADGIDAEIYDGEYNLFRQELLSSNSALDDFKPQIILLATGADQVSRFPELDMNGTAVVNLVEEEIEDWANLWQTADARWGATVLQNNFEILPGDSLGHFAVRHPAAKANYLERLNRMLAERAPGNVVLHDLRGLAAEAGAQWRDPRLYHEFKMPCAPEWLVVYAHSVVSLIKAIFGKSKKVLVLDLDNTIWGGVVGDFGSGGIQLGEGTGEGEAFLAFQRHAKELRQRGVILAVCSKNDEATAKEPFERRPDMVLKLDDISCFIANWEDKANNIRIIAERLGLKTDSFVFVDDNPAERALVRRFLPEVAVPELPDDPSGYLLAVARHRYFETTALTREDVSRAEYYSQNVQRKELAAKSVDLDSFLRSLQMSVTIEPITELNIERATQLINKSNQFNLTTRRYAVAQIRDFVADPAWITLTFSLRDRLGDNGLISVLLLAKQANALSVDTWVMSCRVLQRGVENLTRNCLVELARKEGAEAVLGRFIPTAKNAMVRNHYSGLGFKDFGVDGEQTIWRLDVDDSCEPLPHFIEKGNT